MSSGKEGPRERTGTGASAGFGECGEDSARSRDTSAVRTGSPFEAGGDVFRIEAASLASRSLTVSEWRVASLDGLDLPTWGMMMNWTCPHCAQPIEVPPQLLGLKGLCPHCEGEIDFPDASRPGSGSEDDHERRRRQRIEKGISLLIAILFHVGLFVVLAVLISHTPRSEGRGTEVGIAELPGESLTETEEGSLESAPIAEAATSDELSPPVEIAMSTDLAEADAMMPTLVPSGGASGAGGDGLDLRPAGGGGSGTMRFMGIEGSGSRFLIIADRSASMTGPKLEFVKAEILKTLGDLQGGAKFFVIFFDDVATPIPGNRWLSGRPQAAKAARWVRSIFAQGGTNPIPAFQIAFLMNPRPDTIFFMTDGLFPVDVPQQVALLNNGKRKVVIHTISFVDRSAEYLLRQIAEQSGGKYRHVDH